MGYKTIVCGVTASNHAQKAALEAAIFAKRDNATLVYVYAVDVTFLRTGISMGLPHSAVEQSLERLGGQILDHAAEIAATQGVAPKKVLKRGAVLQVLKQVVREENADLLLLGHEERTTIEKALLKGDVEDHIVELKRETGVEVSVVR
jgi:nucleotide-binding universal stress UspA family protein